MKQIVINFLNSDEAQFQAGLLIEELKEVKGAINYDGDASVQVLLPLNNGKFLRIGMTDDDVAEHPHSLWADNFVLEDHFMEQTVDAATATGMYDHDDIN